MARLPAMMLAAFAIAPAAIAQEAEWIQQDDLTSAEIVEQGGELLSSSAFLDGRDNYISITYWAVGSFRRQVFRCVDRVNSFGESRRSRCALASS